MSPTGDDIPLERNKSAYELLFNLENGLRAFIHDKLDERFRDEGGWIKRVPRKIITKCERRALREKNSYQDLGSDFFIDYADFKDLKDIILDAGNWTEVFVEYFRNESEIAVKLEELEPIRNTIAHNRMLSENEFSRLQIFARDLNQRMQSTSSV